MCALRIDFLCLAGAGLVLAGCELLAGIDDRFVAASDAGVGASSSGTSTGTTGGGATGGEGPGCPEPAGPPECVACDFPCTSGKRCPAPKKLVAGEGHSCLLLDDGALWCWGDQSKGQLAQGPHADASPPVRVACLPHTDDVVTGQSHTCAIDTADRSVWCWGENTLGQCGSHDPIDNVDIVERPTRVDLPDRVAALDAQGRATCALTESGQVHCWGLRLDGQSWADTPYRIHPEPEEKLLPRPAERIGVSDYRACAAIPTDSGQHDLVCWGDGDAGQLGQNAMLDSPGGVEALWPATLSPESIRGGSDHVCALGSDGTIFCWGDCAAGQCATAPAALDECPYSGNPGCLDTPLDVTPIVATDGAIVALDAGWRHTCVLDDASKLYCWGSNDDKQVSGAGQGVAAPLAVQSSVTMFATGWVHTCTVKSAKVWCWGSNDVGQIAPDQGPADVVAPRVIEFPR